LPATIAATLNITLSEAEALLREALSDDTEGTEENQTQ
jgi:hypothetical protein